MNGQDAAKHLRAHFTSEEMDNLEIVTRFLGLRISCWPGSIPDVLYVVADRCLLIPRALTQPYRRWAIANAIGHWVTHPQYNEYRQPLTPLKRAALRYQSASFAFHLLVDVDQADCLGLTGSAEIGTKYGIPADIIEAYQGEWLVPLAGVKLP